MEILNKTWGWLFLESGRLGQITTQQDFDDLHKLLFDELRECWLCVSEKSLSPGGAVKLINLLILHECMHDLELRNRSGLLKLIHVPLDRYVLSGIRAATQGLDIPSNPSMGVIRDYAHYLRIQTGIRDLTGPLNLEPIIVNYATWGVLHDEAASA